MGIKKNKWDVAFEKALNKGFNKLLSDLKYNLNNINGLSKRQKLDKFRTEIIELLVGRFKFKFGKHIGKIDPYLSGLIKIFAERKRKSKGVYVTNFIENDLYDFQFDFRTVELAIPWLSTMPYRETIDLLADYLSQCLFLKATKDLDFENDDETNLIIELLRSKDPIHTEDYEQFAYAFEGDEISDKPVKNATKIIKGTESEFSLARQVLVLHYIFGELGIKGVDNTEKARFVQLLTGKEINAKTIKNTNTYKLMRNPFSISDNQLLKDLQFIRNYFEKLGLATIVKKINDEIEKHK
jgi:hypothetical protein